MSRILNSTWEAGRRKGCHRGRGRLTVILAAGCLCLVFGVGLRQAVYHAASEIKADPEPLPRPRIDAPFITSSDVVVEKMLEVAKIRKEDLVYDLGCGDGRIVVTAAAKYGCRGVGFDKNPERVRESNENAKRNGVEQLVRIEQKDIFTLDLSEADVVVMYLNYGTLNALVPQFQAMRPGSRIVSHDFPIRNVVPDEVADVPGGESGNPHRVFMWITPLKRSAAGKPASR